MKSRFNCLSTVLGASCLLWIAGCGGDEGGPSGARLAEAEITTDYGTSTIIRRAQISYAEGSGQIRDIVVSVNGVESGRMEAEYSGPLLATVDVLDADGDRGEIAFAYNGGRVTAMQSAAPSAYTMVEEYDYDDGRDGVPREVTTRMTPVGGNTQTTYRRFEHNDRRFLERITNIDGQDTTVVELRYDELDRIERSTVLAGTNLVDTYTYTYDNSGRIETVSSQTNDRWDVYYDEQSRISEIRKLSPSSGETTTIRYSYLEGSIEGMRFTPDLPNATLFNLRGATNATVDFLSLSPAGISVSVPSPVSGGGGGGGGGGGAPMCAGLTAENTCEVCAFTNCCSPYEQCVNSNDCVSFYNCVSQCTDSTCYESCGSQYPLGRSYYESYANCANSNCSAECSG